jgi:Sortase domain
VVSGAVGLTMIVLSAGATLLGQGQQVPGTPVPAGLTRSAGPEQQAGPAPAPVTSPSPAPTTSPAPPPPALTPNSVLLPRGGHAQLLRSGVGADGSLQVPDGVTKAALWGATLDAPAGATLLAGHINWAGVAGPFAELWAAQQGDVVTVVDQSGRQLKFAVRQVLTVDKDTLPQHADELFGQAGAHRLVLVTCGGKWVGGTLGYGQNRVVIASPVT